MNWSLSSHEVWAIFSLLKSLCDEHTKFEVPFLVALKSKAWDPVEFGTKLQNVDISEVKFKQTHVSYLNWNEFIMQVEENPE